MALFVTQVWDFKIPKTLRDDTLWYVYTDST